MKRTYSVLFMLIAALLLAGTMGCGGTNSMDLEQAGMSQGPIKPEPSGDREASAYADLDLDWTWDLIAGQNMHAGTVHVYNDAYYIYVEYTLFDGWLMEEAHVLVSPTQPGEKDGAPGKFPYKMEFDPPVASYTFEIPLSDFEFDPKGGLYIATHAATTNGETIWGGDWNDGDPSYDFNWKKWGGGFTTNLMPIYDLPAAPFYYWAKTDWSKSYWRVHFVPDGPYPFPGGNDWAGWCVDPQGLYAGTTIWTKLYSCYDPNLPDYAKSDNWDLISYILTQRNKGMYSSYSKQDIQDAIWYFKYGLSSFNNPSANGWLIIADAMANGEDFIPGPGEYFAVILWPGLGGGLYSQYPTKWQMNIIEVDP